MRPTCAGPATRKAARRLSRPTPPTPSRSSASTSRSRRSSRAVWAACRDSSTITFTSIDQSIARGDADIGLSGIEDTPARRATLAVTVPYYEFREVLTVRTGDAGRLRTLADLAGRRVGTLGGTIAYEILLRAADASTASVPSRTTTTCIHTATC